MSPPAGPVTGTMKTLEEVEPRINVNMLPGDASAVHVISQDGSYMLTADVIGQIGKNGIRIDADNVDLDGRGFALRGGSGTLDAIRVDTVGTDTWQAVARANIIGWSGLGVSGPTQPGIDLRDLWISNCAGGGVEIGDRALVMRVMVEDCGGDGISVGPDSMVSHSTAINVLGDGIWLGDGTMCVNTMVDGTGALGLVGLNVKVDDCMIHNAGSDGVMLVGMVAKMTGCEIRGSGGDGIKVMASGATIERCTVVGSGGNGATGTAGFTVWNSNKFASNGLAGMVLTGERQMVTGCSITGNAGPGLSATTGTGCQVRDSQISAVGVSTSYLVAVGRDCHLDHVEISAKNCTFTGAMVELSDQSSMAGSTTDMEGGSADSVIRCGLLVCWYNRPGTGVVTGSTLATAVINIEGPDSMIEPGVWYTSGASAPTIVRIANTDNAVSSFSYRGDSLGTAPANSVVDVVGSGSKLLGFTIANVPGGKVGIHVGTGGDGNEIEGCRISGTGTGAYTAIEVQSNNNVVISNRMSALMGGVPVSNLGSGNLVGEIENASNFGAGCDPCGNIVH